MLKALRRIAKLCGLFALSGLCLDSAPTWAVSIHGAGRIRLGMSLAQVRSALGDRRASLRTYEDSTDTCAYLESSALPKPLGIMFQRGIVVRADVFEPGIRTAGGAGVGDTEERIKKLYKGHITVETAFYDPGGHFLDYEPAAGSDVGIVFETDGSKVTSYRAGTKAAIALVEGCS
jgi:hypothetical protein